MCCLTTYKQGAARQQRPAHRYNGPPRKNPQLFKPFSSPTSQLLNSPTSQPLNSSTPQPLTLTRPEKNLPYALTIQKICFIFDQLVKLFS
jgi:hypothetical protein